jgi:hypothetical protein
MKPIHIGLLVAAGVLAGVLGTKLMQSPKPAPQPAPAVAQQVQPETPPPPAEAVPAEPAKTEPAPSPFPEKQKAEPRKLRRAQAPAAAHKTEPPVVAQNTAPAAPVTQPAPPAPEPQAQPAPAAPVYHEPAPPPPPHKVTLPVGTLLSVRLVEGLASDRNNPGDTFTATLDQPLSADGFVIAERGARLEGKVVEVKQSGRVSGLGEINIALTKLRTSDGQTIPITTDTFTKVAPKTVKQDVERGAAATGIGAAIGAIAGGGKGAGIGAAIGASAGIGGAMATRGKPATLPTETRLQFRLSDPVTITERR